MSDEIQLPVQDDEIEAAGSKSGPPVTRKPAPLARVASPAELLPEDEDDDPEADEETVSLPSSSEDELDEIYSQRGQAELEEQPEDAPEEVREPERQPTGRGAAPARESRSSDPSNVPVFLLEEVQKRALKANERLRAQLTGLIGVKLEDRRQCFLFDWREATPCVTESTPEELEAADCLISLKARSLTQIATGALNAHVAMLSDKISVSGRLGLAIYFFNLVAPAPR